MDEHGMLMLHHTVSPMLSNPFRLQVWHCKYFPTWSRKHWVVFVAATPQHQHVEVCWEIVVSNARLSPRELSRESMRWQKLCAVGSYWSYCHLRENGWFIMIQEHWYKLGEASPQFTCCSVLWTCFLFHIAVIHTVDLLTWHGHNSSIQQQIPALHEPPTDLLFFLRAVVAELVFWSRSGAKVLCA